MTLSVARLRALTVRCDVAAAPVRFMLADGRDLVLVGWEVNGELVLTLAEPPAEPACRPEGPRADLTRGDRVPNAGEG